MPVINQPKVTCDECGIEKQATNNWYVVVEKGDSITIYHFNLTHANKIGAKVFCGSGHLTKYISQRIK